MSWRDVGLQWITLSKDNKTWLLSACIRSMKPRHVHAAESNPAAATAQPSSATCGHHPAGQRLVLLWFSWIMRFEAYGHCLMHSRLQFDHFWNWQSPLSSSYSLTHQNEVVYVHTEPQNFILGHSSWSRQQIHLPASLTSAQLTDQPQMSSSFEASVHAARRLASQLQPSSDVPPQTDGYKHFFQYRDPFVILGLINRTPHLQVQLLLKHCPVPQSHQAFFSFVFFVSSF